MKDTQINKSRLLIALSVLTGAIHAGAQGTAFTYQGQLQSSVGPANGSYDLRFILYDASVGGNQNGPILTNKAAGITNGQFMATLDFGSAVFTGGNHWLDIAVRTNGTGNFAELSPRQALTPTPYAIFAEGASAGGLTGTIALAQLPAKVVTNNDPNVNLSGAFNGDGAGLSNLNASQVTGGVLPNGVLAGFQAPNYATIAGGLGNVILTNAPYAFIGGGAANTASGNSSTVSGGTGNIAGSFATTGGGYGNFTTGNYSAISGGYDNSASGSYATVAGGDLNSAGNDYATAAGGQNNTASGKQSFVGGGVDNVASGLTSTVAGGYTNIAGGQNAFAGGGEFNTALGKLSFVGGGVDNVASGPMSTVAGGYTNIARGTNAFVGGGEFNIAGGQYSVVDGGAFNVAGGDYSFAAGSEANAGNANSFVWSDGSAFTSSSADSSVTFRASGGYRFFTLSGTVGARLDSGTTAWSALSDRNAKKDIEPEDCLAVLDKLAGVPIARWRYRWEGETNTPHIGPMAQDFKHAFYPGRDDKGITTLEFDGVELAAICGLNQKLDAELKRRDAENARLQAQVAGLKSELEGIQKTLARLAAASTGTLAATTESQPEK